MYPTSAIHLSQVMLGDGGVGKTSLTNSYISKSFQNEYDPTIEDWYTKQTTVSWGGSGQGVVL